MDGERKSQMVEITAAQLPLHCPVSEDEVWKTHPRVFLSIGEDGQAVCPYCGTHYVVKGEVAVGH